MNNALRDTLVVESMYFFTADLILKEGRTCRVPGGNFEPEWKLSDGHYQRNNLDVPTVGIRYLDTVIGSQVIMRTGINGVPLQISDLSRLCYACESLFYSRPDRRHGEWK